MTYLGGVLSEDWGTMLGRRDVDVKVRVRIHNAITIPIIACASESWT